MTEEEEEDDPATRVGTAVSFVVLYLNLGLTETIRHSSTVQNKDGGYFVRLP